MDGMTNGDGMQIVMLLYDVDGFSDEELDILQGFVDRLYNNAMKG